MGRAFEYRKAAKMKRWGTMSRLFPKLGKIITMAAKEGGQDPDMNPKLRTAILNAKAQNMPKDNIDAAIKRASAKDAADIKELTYDVKAVHGVQMIVECATDNNTRTVANVKAILARNGGEMLTSGSLNFMFTRKCVFVFNKTDDMDLEELELELIDFGLEEIEEDIEPQEVGDDINIVRVYGDFTAFGELSKALEDMNIEVKKATLEYIANTPIELSDEQMEEVDVLIDKLEEDEDVQSVFTNIA
ncbi:YebC/PmpR family DNA-binding transcriptional regulator [Sulfurovum sp. XGS-02]|uniref:YebC/PmpR family DNA-binding transcriptional regulator n=1 Tax=Sulfurovum sp. XGS-02 TaxID=2925411 RepID=UPI002069EF05|nr:YebC/PmpR family DNA-binding transcriptional regulator [Sulfurovum sp. XGS-02]UPT76890.1 YebC/PmpR family DNA-binding transcriptional regulator [Sulfurovum sp. XGS-02]